jgi:hypothetical protein
MSNLTVGSLSGLSANNFVIDVASGSKIVQPGAVLQVVRATDTTNRTTTSTSFVDVTGMSVTITPTSTSSKIIVTAQVPLTTIWSTGNDGIGYLQITDSGNTALSGAQSAGFGVEDLSGTGTRDFLSHATVTGYVEPATTSPVTYKLRFRSVTSNVTTFLGMSTVATGQIYAMEIAG